MFILRLFSIREKEVLGLLLGGMSLCDFVSKAIY